MDNFSKALLARDLIAQTEGRVFGATAVCRKTGKIRRFNAKTTHDSFTAYDDARLVLVQEINASRREGRKAYRAIALENLLSLRINGLTLSFKAAEVLGQKLADGDVEFASYGARW